MERVGAIVPAAGHGRRMGGRDKLFLPLGGRPLLAWCVDTLERSDLVGEVVVALNPAGLKRAALLSEARGWRKTRACLGGARRQDSVAAALRLLGSVDWVLVHDGDRPFLTERLIQDGIDAARETGAAVAAVPSKDTIKVVDATGLVVQTLERDALRAVQTPQVFRAEVLLRAYALTDASATDDATLVERLGCHVRLYDGAYENLKVTTPDDLVVARAIARRWEGAR